MSSADSLGRWELSEDSAKAVSHRDIALYWQQLNPRSTILIQATPGQEIAVGVSKTEGTSITPHVVFFTPSSLPSEWRREKGDPFEAYGEVVILCKTDDPLTYSSIKSKCTVNCDKWPVQPPDLDRDLWATWVKWTHPHVSDFTFNGTDTSGGLLQSLTFRGQYQQDALIEWTLTTAFDRYQITRFDQLALAKALASAKAVLGSGEETLANEGVSSAPSLSENAGEDASEQPEGVALVGKMETFTSLSS